MVVSLTNRLFQSAKHLLFITLFIFFFASCEKKTSQIQFGGEIQGTYYKLTYYDSQGRNFHTSVDSLLHNFDLTASLWVKNSMLSRVNNNDTTLRVNDDFVKLFLESKRIYDLTDGAFDPSIGAIVNVWGFGNYERQDVNKELIDSLMQFSKFDFLELRDKQIIKKDSRLKFDFNAIAQGYSVDLVGDLLHQKGIHNFLIDIGGELLASGYKPHHKLWTVGIEKPQENASYGEALQTKIKLTDKAIATSGSYRKFYEKDGIKYAHTIDPKTAYPVTHNLLSASVITKNCITADAIATALMVMGPDKARRFAEQHPEFQVYLISSDEHGGYTIYSTIE